ncbi:hypothetical protein AHAS_Ahas11G0083600 [Arachis hypogaea]
MIIDANPNLVLTPDTNQSHKTPYKHKVMANNFSDNLNPEEIVQMMAEDYTMDHIESENEEIDPQAPFNAKPTIEVLSEEYDEWCRP